MQSMKMLNSLDYYTKHFVYRLKGRCVLDVKCVKIMAHWVFPHCHVQWSEIVNSSRS
jgi:hypothetical protein